MTEINDFLGVETYAYQYGHVAHSNGDFVDQTADTYNMIVLYAPRPIQVWSQIPKGAELGVQIVNLQYRDIPVPGKLNARMRGVCDVFTRKDADKKGAATCAFYESCKAAGRACVCIGSDARQATLSDSQADNAGTYRLQSIQVPPNRFRLSRDLQGQGPYEKFYDLFPCHAELRRFVPPMK